MSIDPARHAAQRRALTIAPAPSELRPRKRPPSRSCSGGCGKRTRDPSGTCPRCQVLEEQRVVERLTVEELHQIIAAARAELARRADLTSQILATT